MEWATCEFCRGRLGVYEPITVEDSTGTRTTSLAREPELAHRVAIIAHADCSEADRARSRAILRIIARGE